MTTAAAGRGSRFWHAAFRVMYRGLRLVDPLVRSYLALGLPGLDGVVRISVLGRRSGRRRQTLVTLLRVGPAWYIGHPNGQTGWTLNAEAAGAIGIDPAPGVAGGRSFRVARLEPGPERAAVVEATAGQQPFPGNLVYRAAAGHIAAFGVYFRVERDPEAHPAGRDRPARATAAIPP